MTGTMGTIRSPMSRWCTKFHAWPNGLCFGCTRTWATSKSCSRVRVSTKCLPSAASTGNDRLVPSP